MSASDWIVLLLATTALGAGTVFVYRRREPAGRGRGLLAALRTGALALVVLLLLDPVWGGRDDGATAPVVVLDESLSMLLEGAEGVDRWGQAVAEAERASAGGPVLLFGEDVRPVRPDSLAGVRPGAARSRLLPAVKAAAELGAGRVLVITDRGVEDAAEVARWLPRLGLEVEFRAPPPPARGVVLAEVDVPGWAEADRPVPVGWTLASPHGAPQGDSLTLTVRSGGALLATQRVPVPAAGRLSTGTLEVRPPPPVGGGPVRLDVALEGRDPATGGSRSAYVHVGPRPEGVVIVSVRPDQEPRFLQPALAEALGVPVRSFLRVGEGRWARAGTGLEAAAPAADEEVRAAFASARVAVLHGAGPGAPAWLTAAAAAHPRLVVFPGAEGSVPGTPLVVGPPLAGDWYLADQVPPSPLAPLLVGVGDAVPPPLEGVRSPAGAPAGAWLPLAVRRGSQGSLAPLALAAEEDGRRWVVPLGEGYWRWSFRGGEARSAYRRLWAALGGWLVRDAASVERGAVHPEQRSVLRGEAPRWMAPGRGGDTLRLELRDAAGASVMDSTLVLEASGAVPSPVLPPGHYTYTARVGDAPPAEGPLTVEHHADEWVRPPVALADVEPAGGTLGRRGGGGAVGAPLRASPWPWLAILLLLGAEWTLRRRWGLR